MFFKSTHIHIHTDTHALTYTYYSYKLNPDKYPKNNNERKKLWNISSA